MKVPCSSSCAKASVRKSINARTEGSSPRRDGNTRCTTPDGARQSGKVEIVDGIVAGTRIVVDGTVKLREGSKISDAGTSKDASS